MKKIFCFSLAILLCFSCFISTSYASNYQDVNEFLSTFDGNPTDYIVGQSKATGVYYMSIFFDYEYSKLNAGAEFNATLNTGNTPILNLKKPDNSLASYHVSSYYADNSGNWVHQTTLNDITESALFGDVKQKYDLIESTFNVNNSDGSIFFGATPPSMELYQIIQEIATVEMENQKKNLVGTMKILTVCGVGLIALLVGLVLFGKVLRPYLPR